MPLSLDHQPHVRSGAVCAARVRAPLVVAGGYFFYGYWFGCMRA